MNVILQPQRPHLALTVGDPAGIGPEVVLKALADPTLTQQCQVTVVGSHRLLQATYTQLKHQTSEPLIAPDRLSILDVDIAPELEDQITLGAGNAASGAASFAYLETAIAHALSGKFHGIVTGPIAKSAWKAAGHHYPGQTELLAARANSSRFGMLFVAQSPHCDCTLRVLLATTHIPLRQVVDILSPQLLAHKLDLLVQCLRDEFGLTTPRIAIAGLNPHSGEQGQLGHEEQDWLIPWLEQERRHRLQVQLDGPIPPDTLWVKPGQAWHGLPSSEPIHDAYLALYHDQGLIPVKLMAFDRAVNTTIGLPFVRTSPDHGTAFDIAGQGIARSASLQAAVRLAITLVQQRFTCRYQHPQQMATHLSKLDDFRNIY
jgi:4-hydroxythreonine-4-phosphate dehydrogenase